MLRMIDRIDGLLPEYHIERRLQLRRIRMYRKKISLRILINLQLSVSPPQRIEPQDEERKNGTYHSRKQI
jgi:hypothetical protein